MEKNGAINIFSYDNYREYLKDYYQIQKAHTKFFSYRYFSLKANFSSPSVLRKVITGTLSISKRSIPRFCKALNLAGDEADYFQLLVLYNQARNDNEKLLFLREMARFKNNLPVRILTELQLSYYKEWYNLVVFGLVSLKEFKEDPQTIAQLIYPSVTPQQVKRALKTLNDLKLIKRNKEGRLVDAPGLLSPPRGLLESPVIRTLRLQMIRLEENALNTIPPEDRYATFNTLHITRALYDKIKEILQKTKDDIMNMCVAEDSAHIDTTRSGIVCQMNLHLFPLVNMQLMEKLEMEIERPEKNR